VRFNLVGMSNQPLQVWIEHVFAHPFGDPPWYFAMDAEEWSEPAKTVVGYIAETFEDSGKLLSYFSDEQLEQGFWYLFGDSMETLLDEEVPLACRLRALRSFVLLFEQVMTARCSSHLSHLDEKGANPLNCACYMWFDVVLDRFNPELLARAQLEKDLIDVLGAILAMPHARVRCMGLVTGLASTPSCPTW
jgi:hypothetical protein